MARGQKRERWLPVMLLGLVCAGLIAFTVVRFVLPESVPVEPEVELRTAPPSVRAPEPEPEPELGKKDLAGLIGARVLDKDQVVFEVKGEGGRDLYVRTTLDPTLQAKASDWVASSLAHQAALVMMNPKNGEVLILAGHSAHDDSNAALSGSFPAASLFKIVTAAAAVEKSELSGASTVAYDGGKHTLFKGNVTKKPDQGQNAATLEESFAESINSVFGKLGAYSMTPEDLADFASRFQFNHDIGFEMPVEASRFAVEADEDDPYRIAELASGFNRVTTVSPLHGAMLASAVAAGGALWEPTFVREVFDRDNHIYYQARSRFLGEPVNPATAAELSRFMEAAVREGTGRRTFGDMATHPILSKLVIGGKSGTINNDAGEKVDWFVAWARPKENSKEGDSLALAALVVHGGTTATTSQRLVRDAILAYYKDRL